MPKALRWLIGMRVLAKKSTSVVAPKFKEDVTHTYHNLYFRGRSNTTDGLPRQIGAEELAQTAPADKNGDDPFLGDAETIR
jgi:hypothetical protein